MINVLKPGIHTSFQDMGRYGYRNRGVPLSGAMDRYSAQLANQLVGNNRGDAVLEIMLRGPELHLEEPACIALTGALFDVTVGGKSLPLNQAVSVPAGSTLKWGRCKQGVYGYMAVSGGFDIEKVFESYAYFEQIAPHLKLQKGDTLMLKSTEQCSDHHASVQQPDILLEEDTLEVYLGAEYASLAPEMQQLLTSTAVKVGKDSNRMAYSLIHSENLRADEIITGAVQPGTVQLTPSGSLFVLMRDAQTTGGYARVLQLSETALNRLAQKRPGEEVRFEMVGV